MNSNTKYITSSIINKFHPHSIILFGSQANGKAHSSSDFDILVLYDGSLDKTEVLDGIRRGLLKRRFSLDLFVMAPHDFEQQKKLPNTLAREAYEHGLIIYG